MKFFPTNESRMCSKHSGADMFEKAGYSKRTVWKPHAVPKIFDEFELVGYSSVILSVYNLFCC